MELWIDYFEASLMASVVMLCFILIASFFSIRYRKKYKMLVWMLIMLSLLVPLNIQLWEDNYVVEIPVYTIGEYTITDVPLEVEENNSEDALGQPNSAVDNNRVLRVTTGDVVGVIWIIGIVIFWTYHFLVHKKAYKELEKHSYVCEDEQILLCVRNMAEEIALKNVPLVRIMKDETKSPFSVGVISNTIYLPGTQYAEIDLMYVLRHEMIHCKNHDILIKLAMLLVNGIHWFNPMIWLMRVLVDQDMELICDEEVLKTASKEERREYSEIIMSCISANNTTKSIVSTGYIQGTKFVKHRFNNIFAKDKKNGGYLCVVVTLIIMLLLHGRIQVAAQIAATAIDVPISFGIEIKADVDGDGQNDRVYVKDEVGGTEVHTQLIVQFANGESDFMKYPDYWGAYLISGDLDSDGASDIVLMRGNSGNGYGLGYVNVLRIVNGQWEEYPSTFDKNQSILLEQPDDFVQRPLGDMYVAATIIKRDGKTMLRLILNEDIGNDMVSCIDCSWNGMGWYIEDMQRIENYYAEYKDLELLEKNYIYE